MSIETKVGERSPSYPAETEVGRDERYRGYCDEREDHTPSPSTRLHAECIERVKEESIQQRRRGVG